MRQTVQQIGAIVRYDLIMSWRRGTLPIILVAGLVAIAIGTAAIAPPASALPMTYAEDGSLIPATGIMTLTIAPGQTITIDWERHRPTASASIYAFFVLVIGGITLTFFTNDPIPFDRMSRMRELLRVLPLTHTTYLLGKIAALWTVVAIGLPILFVIMWIVSRLTLGTVEAEVLATLWVLLVGVTLLTIVTVSTCIGVLGLTRRAALWLAVASLPLIGFVFALAVTNFIGVVGLFEPVYLMMFNINPFEVTTADLTANIGRGLIACTLINVLALAGAWLVLRARERA